MPSRTIQRKPSRTLGKGAAKRKDQARQRRQGSQRTQQKDPAVIADSIYSLTLKAKPGVSLAIERKHRRGRIMSDEDDYEQMYKDLLGCYQHALSLIGNPSPFDPFANGLSLSVSIYYVLNAFKSNVLPAGYDVNIDKDDENGYYFTIYKECWSAGYWHAFEIKPVIRKLTRNKKLHDLFISVIKCMIAKADIGTWYDGGMGYAEYMLEEELGNWDDNHGSEDDTPAEQKKNMRAFQKASETLRNYQSGEVKDYEDIIRDTPFIAPEEILEVLNKLKSTSPIVHWMKIACHFLKLPGCINDFIYLECEDLEGLKYDQHVTIIWDWQDAYSDIQCECLDSEAQGLGVNEPTLNFPVTRNLKSLDLAEIEQRSEWPERLSHLFDAYQKMLIALKPKKKSNDKQ
jgi:hypothetical protein